MSSFGNLDATQKQTIINAMQTLENATAINNVPCVQFRERVATTDPHFIYIHNGVGCSSYVSF